MTLTSGYSPDTTGCKMCSRRGAGACACSGNDGQLALFAGAATSVAEATAATGAAGRLVTTANKDVRSAVTCDSVVAPVAVAKGQAKEILRAAEASAVSREQRLAARKMLWEVSTISRVATCGRYSRRKHGTVDLKLGTTVYAENGRAPFQVRKGSFSGVTTCGSVWTCPVCAAKIQAERREELGTLVKYARERNLTVAFGTMTLRHHKGLSLGKTWSTLSKCYKAVREDRMVRRHRKALGMDGYVRAVEVTHGGNGWHPHIHQLYLLDLGQPNPKDYSMGSQDPEFQDEVAAFNKRAERSLAALGDAEYAVWARTAVSAGLGRPLRERYEVKLVNGPEGLTDYLVKSEYKGPTETFSGLSKEMQGSVTKRGRKGSRTPFQILEDVRVAGLSDFRENGVVSDDLALWHEYEQASHGRRALTWSRGLKDAAGVNEKSDEEIAEGEEQDQEILLTIAAWTRDMCKDEGLQSGLLRAVEANPEQSMADARAAGEQYCADHGIELMPINHPDAVADRGLEERRFMTQSDDAAAPVAKTIDEILDEEVQAEEDAAGRAVMWTLDWLPGRVDVHHIEEDWAWNCCDEREIVSLVTERVEKIKGHARPSAVWPMIEDAPGRVRSAMYAHFQKRNYDVSAVMQWKRELKEIQRRILEGAN